MSILVSKCCRQTVWYGFLMGTSCLLSIFLCCLGGADVSVDGVDYGNSQVVVTFTAGSTVSSNAIIPIAEDGPGGEGTEQFRASFEIPAGYPTLQRGTPSEAVIDIVEDALPRKNTHSSLDMEQAWVKSILDTQFSPSHGG